MVPDVMPLVEQLATSVARQRVTLEAGDPDAMADALEDVQRSLDALLQWPGGIPGLRQQIESLGEAERDLANALIEKASEDHRICGDLIQIGLQRTAALKAFIAQKSESSTYGADGEMPQAAGSMLSIRT